ncbi:MAG: lipopolysaccharide biosynthesis protein [Gemmatimonadaceae bacterium]|nr:lipopolysaccharide biosynthesis protein [Gemmatimonadaceae bacterium]
MATELAVMVSGLIVLRLAASMLDPAGFGEYALSRRAIGLLYLPLLMGLGIAAPRYIAIAKSGALPGFTERSFVLATLSMGLLPALAAVTLLNAIPAASSTLLFGDETLRHLVPATSMALAGIAMHSIAYAVHRGRSDMLSANLLQFINLALVPVAAFLYAGSSAGAVLQLTGLSWLGTSIIAFLQILFLGEPSADSSPGIRRHFSLLYRFGLPRIPGEFALVGLFAIPSLIALRVHGVVLAGQFSAAISLVALLSGVFAPVGLILLPRASAQVARGEIADLRKVVGSVLAAGAVAICLAVAIGLVVIPRFIEWYFGAAFLPAVPIFRACLIGAIPYAIYVLLRNILDALDVKAVNTRNLLAALGMLIVLCMVRSDLMWMSASLVGSLVVLAVLSVRETFVRLVVREVSTPAGVPGVTTIV